MSYTKHSHLHIGDWSPFLRFRHALFEEWMGGLRSMPRPTWSFRDSFFSMVSAAAAKWLREPVDRTISGKHPRSQGRAGELGEN